MRNTYVICLMVMFTLFSCKNETKTTEPTAVKATENENSAQLSNLTDDNWTGGVGNIYNMFLIDYSEKNEALLKTATNMELVDGTTIKIGSYDVVKPYIRINLEGKASDYKAKAAFPNYIFFK